MLEARNYTFRLKRQTARQRADGMQDCETAWWNVLKYREEWN